PEIVHRASASHDSRGGPQATLCADRLGKVPVQVDWINDGVINIPGVVRRCQPFGAAPAIDVKGSWAMAALATDPGLVNVDAVKAAVQGRAASRVAIQAARVDGP